MKRISTATAVQNRFVDGNKSTGQKATQFSAEWCNQIQEEIAGLLEANGVALGASEKQLVALFSKVFASGFNSIHMSKNGSQLEADGEKLIVTKSTQGGNYTAKLDKDGMIVGFPTIGYIRYGLRKIEFLAADGTTKVGEFSLDNGKFEFDKFVDVTGGVNATGTIKSSGGAVVGTSLEATAGGVQATGDISTSNGNLSGKNVNATGNIQTTNGNVSASGDVTAKNGKVVLSSITSGSNLRPAGLWMNDGASSNRKGASVAMDTDGLLHISGDGGVKIGGIVEFSGKTTLDYGFPENKKSVILASADLDISVNDYKDSYPSGTTLRIVNYNSTQINVTYHSNTTRAIGSHSFADFFIVEISGNKLWFVQG